MKPADAQAFRAALGGMPGTDRTWWEADHIVEVADGGGCCGLDNYQTLCRVCHVRKTRESAAARRKAAKESEVDGTNSP